MSTSTVDAATNGGRSPRRAVVAACIGNAAEWYDFAVYGAFATVTGFVFFPVTNVATALSAAFAVYGTALIVRPLGALVFGRLGDTRGRRRVLVTVILLMTIATAGIGFLPGYAVIGLVSPILLVLLRATQGLAAGGELGAAAVFILENAARARRGQAGAWQTATMALGIAAGMALAGSLSLLFNERGGWSGWWRIAFVLALPLGLVGLHLRRRVAETQQFVHLQTTSTLQHRPAQELWTRHKRAVARGFCLVAAGSLAFNVFFIFLPNNLIARHGADLSEALLATAGSLLVTALAAVTLGRVSDRLGRRPVALASCVPLALLAVPAAVVGSRGSMAGLVLAQVVIGITVAGVLSVAMLGEAFPAPVRSTGVALTAGLATAFVGGTGPLISQLIVTRTAIEAAPGGYLAVVAALAVVALWGWPETAFQDLG
ncbi:MAG: MFS transporter [Propionibacteriaceae bacterium]